MHRPFRSALATAVLGALLVAPVACTGDGGDHLVSGDGWRGVLLDHGVDGLELPDGRWLDDVDSFRPSEDAARRFEEALPDALADASNPSGERVTEDDLDDYVRQYTGVWGGGEVHLVVAGLCAPEDFPEWETRWIEVADGGACFWRATMDLETGEILGLGFNGSA